MGMSPEFSEMLEFLSSQIDRDHRRAQREIALYGKGPEDNEWGPKRVIDECRAKMELVQRVKRTNDTMVFAAVTPVLVRWCEIYDWHPDLENLGLDSLNKHLL